MKALTFLIVMALASLALSDEKSNQKKQDIQIFRSVEGGSSSTNGLEHGERAISTGGIHSYGRDYGGGYGHGVEQSGIKSVGYKSGRGEGIGGGRKVILRTVTIARPVFIPQPYTFTVNRPVPVPRAVPFPVHVPRPVPVSVPHAVPIEVPRPVPVTVLRLFPVAVPRAVAVPVQSVPATDSSPIAVPLAVSLPDVTGGFGEAGGASLGSAAIVGGFEDDTRGDYGSSYGFGTRGHGPREGIALYAGNGGYHDHGYDFGAGIGNEHGFHGFYGGGSDFKGTSGIDLGSQSVPAFLWKEKL